MADGEPAADPQLIDSRVGFAGRRIQVAIDRLRMPDGSEQELERIHHPGAAAIVPLLPTGDVLLVRQYRHATGGWLLEVPAGTLDAGEAPEVCAARELEEETGFVAGALQPLGWIWTTPGFTGERIWLYLATDLTVLATLGHRRTPPLGPRPTISSFSHSVFSPKCLSTVSVEAFEAKNVTRSGRSSSERCMSQVPSDASRRQGVR